MGLVVDAFAISVVFHLAQQCAVLHKVPEGLPSIRFVIERTEPLEVRLVLFAQFALGADGFCYNVFFENHRVYYSLSRGVPFCHPGSELLLGACPQVGSYPRGAYPQSTPSPTFSR